MRWTPADVLALRVDAGAVLTGLRALAFVHVGAVAAGSVELVALVALAAEHTEDVLATTEDAEVAEHLALVDVHASLLVALVRVHEAHLALAAISTGVVQAVPIFAERTVLRALVDVLAAVAVASKASVAHALKGTLGVDAVRIGVAAAVVRGAFVDVPTLDSVPGEALVTGAHVRALGVLALGELAAGIGVQPALVVVGARRSLGRFHRVSLLAAAVKGADRVVALAVSADPRLRHALVDVYAGYTVPPGQQAVRAVAYVATLCVLAFTSVANARVLLALVNIRASSTVQVQSVASAARTGEAARRVQTNVFAAAIANRAFIDVLAMRSKARLLIAIVAYALIGAHHVLADAIRAYTTGS